jgi:hypothetical protein
MFEFVIIALPSPFALDQAVVGIRGGLSSPSEELYARFIGLVQTAGSVSVE